MDVLLQPISRADRKNHAIYHMLQECPLNENGFQNNAYGLAPQDFAAWISRGLEISRGIGLPEGYMRQTIYWLFIDGRPVGSAKLRHGLNDALRVEGGNIGYGIRPTERGKGYGRLLLGLMLVEARRQGLDCVLVTIANSNIPSLRVAQANGGSLDKRTPERSYFWFDLMDMGGVTSTGGMASTGGLR